MNLRAFKRLLAFGMIAMAAACSSSNAAKKKPMGVIPSASTKAVPEWLPERIRAGISVEADAREAHLFDVRRMTEGWDVRQVGWAPDRSVFVIMALKPGEAQPALYAVPASTAGNPARLGRPADVVRSFAIVGDKAAWRVVYATAGSLVEVDPVSSKAAPIDSLGLDVEAVASGPDDSLLLVAKDAGKTKIFRAEKGGAPKAIVSEDIAPIAPALSPDRAYVAFGRGARATGAGALGYSSVEGRSGAELVDVSTYTLRGVSFHPSGRWIAFSSDRDSAGFDLYALQIPATLSVTSRAKVAEARTVRLTFTQADAPAFSPDGNSVAFTSRRRGPTPDLYVARFVEDP